MASPASNRLDALPGRLLGGLLALVLGLLAVFLFTAFAVLAAILAIVVGVRAWWRGRHRRGRGGDGPRTITVEYSVAHEDVDAEAAREPDAVLPPPRRRP